MMDGADILLTKGLFGEATQLPDVMHCETIAARSSLHDWELAPHRHGHLHQVMLVQSGHGVVDLEGQPLPFESGALVNVPPGVVHAFRFEPGTEGYVVTLADEILEQMLASAGEVRLALARPGLSQAPAELGALMARIWQEFNGLGSARALMLRGLCSVLLATVARQMGQDEPGPSEVQGSRLLQRFEALLQAHYLSHWGVADYARALSVSTTHLSRVVRAATGQPVSQRIQARIVREARQRLAYTHLSVSSIAYSLGFADPAHFSRVFARDAGLSPRAFRQRLSP